MKKIILIIVLMFSTLMMGQVPTSFGHRGVVFGLDSLPIKNTQVRVEVNILNGTTDNAKIEYSENHMISTNERGEYAIKIGEGIKDDKLAMEEMAWAEGGKYLRIAVYDINENLLGVGINQLMSVPYALVANELAGSNSSSCIEVVNSLNALRNLSNYSDGDVVYIMGHTNRNDKGGGHFFYDAGFDKPDDNGMIVDPADDAAILGRWRRINYRDVSIAFYGALGGDMADDTAAIQAAIDFQASLNLSGSTGGNVYFPEGRYRVNEIILRDAVSLLGESKTLIEPNPTSQASALVRLESNKLVRRIVIENLHFNGNDANMNCFAFNYPVHNSEIHVAMFRNLDIRGFRGDGFKFVGGQSYVTNQAVNQFITMENVWVTKGDISSSRALYMQGQNGQFNFTNCTFVGAFDGNNNGCQSQIGNAIEIRGIFGGPFTSLINFNTCTIQQADQGVYMESTQNINFNECWFENVTKSVVGVNVSKGINIRNSRFLNAACEYAFKLEGIGFLSSIGTFTNNLLRGTVASNYLQTNLGSDIDEDGTIIDN